MANNISAVGIFGCLICGAVSLNSLDVFCKCYGSINMYRVILKDHVLNIHIS